MSPRESFGQTLKRIRQSKELTQRSIAREISMDFSYYSRLECDRMGTPTRDTILKIAGAIDCTDEQTSELLAAAGRVREEMEEKPLLKSLYRAAANLPEDDLADLVREAEKKLKQQDGSKGG